MTYLAFHAVFIVPPILLLAWRYHRRPAGERPGSPGHLAALAAIALVYTTPWDNHLVRTGVWGYGPDRVIGTVGYVPVEEYLFFILQPLLAGLWLYHLLPARPRPATGRARLLGTLVWAAAAGAGLLLLRGEAGTYLGLILAWAAPVLALQWGYGGDQLWAHRRAWAVGVAVPTAYLWAADAFALHDGIWRISPRFTLGPRLGPLPLEEAVFFLVTNLLVVQGLLLLATRDRTRGVSNERSISCSSFSID